MNKGQLFKAFCVYCKEPEQAPTFVKSFVYEENAVAFAQEQDHLFPWCSHFVETEWVFGKKA